MTSPDGSGGPSPLRVGGLALLGIGHHRRASSARSRFATGGGDGAPAGRPTLACPPRPARRRHRRSSRRPRRPQAAPAPAPPLRRPRPPAAPAPTGPATGAARRPPTPGPAPRARRHARPPRTAPAPGPSASRAARAPVRVYNNSTITGLAARAADDFRNAGWTVEEVGNYPSGIIPTSTVYYRPGTGEQAAAQRIGTEFGLRAEPRFAGLDDASPGLIVIVTNDYQRALTRRVRTAAVGVGLQRGQLRRVQRRRHGGAGRRDVRRGHLGRLQRLPHRGQRRLAQHRGAVGRRVAIQLGARARRGRRRRPTGCCARRRAGSRRAPAASGGGT